MNLKEWILTCWNESSVIWSFRGCVMVVMVNWEKVHFGLGYQIFKMFIFHILHCITESHPFIVFFTNDQFTPVWKCIWIKKRIRSEVVGIITENSLFNSISLLIARKGHLNFFKKIQVFLLTKILKILIFFASLHNKSIDNYWR